MNLLRRAFLQLAAGTAAFSLSSHLADAQAYPSRPIRLIVGLPAGNSPDIVARLIGQWLSERFGQSVIVDNRPGANTNIAAEAVASAPADGYTLLLVTGGNVINTAVYKNLKYDFIRDIAPVASIGGIPFVLIVNPSLPVKTVPEFIAYAKANPGKVYMASSGNGSTLQVLGALFAMMTGVELFHVPYRNSFIPDLLGGQVHLAFNPVPASIDLIRTGRLRALAVTTKQRLEVLPDVPALDEFVPGYEGIGWLGVGAPKNTPAAIIDRLNQEINTGLADPKLSARFIGLGAVLNPMTPSEFEKFIAQETEKWAKVVKFANIKAE